MYLIKSILLTSQQKLPAGTSMLTVTFVAATKQDTPICWEKGYESKEPPLFFKILFCSTHTQYGYKYITYNIFSFATYKSGYLSIYSVTNCRDHLFL